MGGGHEGSTTYKGFTVHQPKRWHVVTGKGLCAIMWVGDILGRDMMIIPMGTDMTIRHLTDMKKSGNQNGLNGPYLHFNVFALCLPLFNKERIMQKKDAFYVVFSACLMNLICMKNICKDNFSFNDMISFCPLFLPFWLSNEKGAGDGPLTRILILN